MKGIADECVKEIVDPETGEIYEAWDCINDETFKSKILNSPKILYSVNATGTNTNIIINFWSYVEEMKLNLLPSEKNADYLIPEIPEEYQSAKGKGKGKKKDNSTPILSDMERVELTAIHMRTDTLLEQISNLEVEANNGKYKLNQITKKIDKDIYSALVYMLYVVQIYMNQSNDNNNNYADFVFYN